MNLKKWKSLLLVLILQTVLVFYFSLSLEEKINVLLNDSPVTLEVYIEKEKQNDFYNYINENNIVLNFKAFKNNEYVRFTSNPKSSGCYIQNHYGFSNDFTECEMYVNNNEEISIDLSNKEELVFEYLNNNQIEYEEFSTSSAFYMRNSIVIVVVFSIFTVVAVYLSMCNRLKETSLRIVNGWRKLQIYKSLSMEYIVPLVISSILLLSIFGMVLKIMYSPLSFRIFSEVIIREYVLAIVLLSVLIVGAIILANIKVSTIAVLKGYKKNTHNIVIGYVFKSLLYLTTIIVSSFAIINIIEIRNDIENISIYEKFDNYYGYQVSEDKLEFYLSDNNNDFVYYTSFAPDKGGEADEMYCLDEYEHIRYCKSMVGNTKFFEILTGKNFDKNTVVIPNKYKDYTDDILESVNSEYSGLKYSVEYLDNTDIYSFNENYSNETKDIIEDAVWIIYADYDPSIHNLRYIYTKTDLGGDYYVAGTFSNEYLMYIDSIKTQIYQLLALLTMNLLMFFYTNLIIVKSTIISNIKKIINKYVNGFTYADIFYLHYSHIIVIAVLSGVISTIVLSYYGYLYITAFVAFTLLSVDLVMNYFTISKITRKSIVNYIKGDEL